MGQRQVMITQGKKRRDDDEGRERERKAKKSNKMPSAAEAHGISNRMT